jgi:hypothetical protein
VRVLAYKYKESPFDYVLGDSKGSLQLVMISGQFYFAHYNLLLWKKGNELFIFVNECNFKIWCS